MLKQINTKILPSISSTMLWGAIILALVQQPAFAKNGFDLTEAIIPEAEIFQGGPPKDGIPALTKPPMINVLDADYLKPTDRILGIEIDGVARAYPIRILNWHEIVNDKINNTNYAITYCPLCGSGVVFDTNIHGEGTDFGVSGLLYNSDVLLYDRKTDSLWSQILSQAISGKLTGEKLKRLPVYHTNWSDWLEKFPTSTVMSLDTGHFRDYDRNPYAGYEKSRGIYFSVKNHAPENYHPKEEVLGLEINGVFKAYPFVEMAKLSQQRFSDNVGGVKLNFTWNAKNRVLKVFDDNGKEIVGVQGYWFAWFAFHPGTDVFKAG